MNSQVDLIATATVHGVVKTHSLRNGHAEHTFRHPAGLPIDGLLVYGAAYVPSILFVSKDDNTIRQFSVNGAHLRDVDLGGRFSHWCPLADPRYLLTAVAPRSGAMSADDQHPLQIRSAFDLRVVSRLPSHATGVDATFVCVSSHPVSPQVFMAGTTNGSLHIYGVGAA